MKSRAPARLKLVLDTSVWVSALLSKGGGSAKVVELVFTGKVFSFYTVEILGEITAVLQRKKFNVEKEKREHFVHLLAESSYLVKSLAEFELARCRDPRDEVFLSLARQVEADFLISLDKDLIVLKKIGGTQIVEPARFLKSICVHER